MLAGRRAASPGSLLGSRGVAIAYATSQGWLVALPWIGIVGGIGVAVVMGAAAGLYPAIRAARVAPTEALRTA